MIIVAANNYKKYEIPNKHVYFAGVDQILFKGTHTVYFSSSLFTLHHKSKAYDTYNRFSLYNHMG